MSRRLGPLWLPMFHVGKGIPYHVGNSVHALNVAASGGYDSVDLDFQVTEPDPLCVVCEKGTCVGHPVNTHWLRPLLRDGFTDPAHKMGRFRRVDDMTRAEALRLITRDGYRIHTAHRMFREAADRDLRVAAELKHPRFAIPAVMDTLMDAVRASGARVRVMKLSDGSRALATLKAAKRAGADTIVIARGPIPAEWRPWIDYERGPARYWR
jgi:hypothetical protein